MKKNRKRLKKKKNMDKVFTELAIANQKETDSSITGEEVIYAFAINMSPFSNSSIAAGNDMALQILEEYGAIDKGKVKEIVLKHINAMLVELSDHRSECEKKNLGIDLKLQFEELSKDDRIMRLFKMLSK